jgi:hypothetical protein
MFTAWILALADVADRVDTSYVMCAWLQEAQEVAPAIIFAANIALVP